MKTIGYATAVLVLLMAGCAVERFPGQLITVDLRNAKATPVAAETGTRTIDEQAALQLLTTEDKQLLAAIRATEKEQGFGSASWSVVDGALRYESFRLGQPSEKSSQIWLQVNWHEHTIQLFATEKVERIGLVATSLSQEIHKTGLDANVTVVENSVPVRPGIF
ncbi:MAG TPA: hypothetical protein VFJ90_02670 [Candidatus Didemnitutus sp.]|nr:hypothetical protein [Candidatus Didemnitutus sp.]